MRTQQRLFTLTLGLSCLMAYPAYSQTKFTSEDRAFFEKQMPHYTRWLEEYNLSALLSFHELKVASDSVVVYLDLAYETLDESVTAWKMAKADFDALNNQTLEEHLFYHLLHLLEIEASECSIELFSSYTQRPYAYIGLYYDQGTFQVITDFTRNVIREVPITPLYLKKIQTASAMLDAPAVRDALYGKVRAFAQKFYQDKNAEIEVLEGDQAGDVRLHFRIWNLRREVLVDEANPLLARILNQFGYQLDWQVTKCWILI
ncbi:MAG: hypothetical protein HC880_09510 [Bacteroidia bacterium]|nr:hypothetical protein [Bacteroidia bacterium]